MQFAIWPALAHPRFTCTTQRYLPSTERYAKCFAHGCEKFLPALFLYNAWSCVGPGYRDLQTFLFTSVATNRTTFGCQHVGEISPSCFPLSLVIPLWLTSLNYSPCYNSGEMRSLAVLLKTRKKWIALAALSSLYIFANIGSIWNHQIL